MRSPGLPNREQSRNRLSSALAAAKQHRAHARRAVSRSRQFQASQRYARPCGRRRAAVPGGGAECAIRCGRTTASAPTDMPSPRSNHIARLGGDEFIVILPSIRSAADAAAVASRLIAELQQPMRLALHTLVVTPSIGIALYPSDGTDVDTLLRNADLAMYFAKRKGPGMYALFDARDERRGVASIHAGGQAARRSGARRVLAALSAAIRREHGRRIRHGGAAALDARGIGAGGARASSSRSPRKPG